MIGPLTIDRHRELQTLGVELQVFVRGEDVTDRCYFADDTPGREVARFFSRGPDGGVYNDADGEAATETAQGADVVIRRRNPAAGPTKAGPQELAP